MHHFYGQIRATTWWLCDARHYYQLSYWQKSHNDWDHSPSQQVPSPGIYLLLIYQSCKPFEIQNFFQVFQTLIFPHKEKKKPHILCDFAQYYTTQTIFFFLLLFFWRAPFFHSMSSFFYENHELWLWISFLAEMSFSYLYTSFTIYIIVIQFHTKSVSSLIIVLNCQLVKQIFQ